MALESAGFDGAPRALGFDEQGREMVTYLSGEMIGERVPWPDWAFADRTLVQVGQWLRRLHDLTAGFRPPALLPVAANLEQSASEAEAFPADFWSRS